MITIASLVMALLGCTICTVAGSATAYRIQRNRPTGDMAVFGGIGLAVVYIAVLLARFG